MQLIFFPDKGSVIIHLDREDHWCSGEKVEEVSQIEDEEKKKDLVENTTVTNK